MNYNKQDFQFIPRTLPGIYKITNTNTGKYYIGYSKQVRLRWQEHVRELNKNKHTNSHLQNSWNNNNYFRFELLEECAIDNLQEREHYWIDKFDCYNKEKGYNLYDNRKAKIWMNIQRKKWAEQLTHEDIVLVSKTNIAERNTLAWNEYKEFSSKNYMPPRKSFKDWFVFGVTENIDELLPDLIRKTIAGGYYKNPIISNGSKQTWVWNKTTRELLGKYPSMYAAAKATGIRDKSIHTNINKKAIKDYLFTSTDFIPESYTSKTGPKPMSVIIDGTEYESYKKASETLGIKEDTLWHKINYKKKEPNKVFKWILYKDTTEIPLIHKVDAINHIPNATKNGIRKLITGERPVYYGWKIRKITENNTGVFNK